MSKVGTLILTLVVVASGNQPFCERCSAEDTLVIKNVTVIPMNTDDVLHDRIVVVHNGKIHDVSSKPLNDIPENAQIIDGTNKYLMPGLIDMHVHVNWEEQLEQFLAFGVTSVRNMSGYPSHARWRREIDAGERLGPTIYSACRTIDGAPGHPLFPDRAKTVTVEQARTAVQRAHTEGWDFIKVYNSLSPEVYEAIIREAKIPVVGHVPFSVGMDTVWSSGQHTIEHLQGFGPWLQSDGPIEITTLQEHSRSWITADRKRIPAVVQRTLEAGIWNCPTLTLYLQLRPLEEFDVEIESESYQHATRAQVAHWRRRTAQMEPAIENIRRSIPNRLAVVEALYSGGARIVAGTDTGMPLVPTGLALHWELQTFVESAGFSPIDAIRAATSDAAMCLGVEDVGTIETGKTADLILLNKNPIEDIGNLSSIAGVVCRGSWLDAAELRQHIAPTR